jgi:proteic killer suppression protein
LTPFRDVWDLAYLLVQAEEVMASDRFRSWFIALSAILDHPLTVYTQGRIEKRVTNRTVSEQLVPMLIGKTLPQTEKIFSRRFSSKLPQDMQRVALRKLRMLNRSMDLNDLKVPPGNRLEALKGDRKGQHSIRINDQFRICFIWKDNNAYDVEIVDYH